MTSSEICTKALGMELNESMDPKLGLIQPLEIKQNFPDVAAKYRVIDDETITVLVPPTLADFENGMKLSPAQIVQGSVRLRKNAAKKFAVRPIAGNDELSAWTLDYDPDFLGYMKGVLQASATSCGEFTNA